MSVANLGYIGLEVSDLDAWRAFAGQVLGLMEGAPTPGGAHRLRLDEAAWRIALEPGPRDDIAYVGFEVATAGALTQVAARLTASGVPVRPGDTARLAERGVCELLTCTDPCGLPVEIYYGAAQLTHTPFVSPAGVRQFVTGQQGLGHLALATRADQMAATRAFYVEQLGFRVSDFIRLGAGSQGHIDVEFYHCNPRHHTLALAPTPVTPDTRLHHFMLQAGDLDDVGRALDRAAREGAVQQGLGRHTNDHMVSFYARTPSPFGAEFGWGGLEIDDDVWRVARHDRISDWGHK